MKNDTLGIIYILKGWGRTKLNTEEEIAEFLRQYRNTDYRYTHEDLLKELKKAAVDYVSTCDNAFHEFNRYMLLSDSVVFPDSEWHRLRVFLGQCVCRNKDTYINGFRDNPCLDLPIFRGIENDTESNEL